jgi:hypothetical protein
MTSHRRTRAAGPSSGQTRNRIPVRALMPALVAAAYAARDPSRKETAMTTITAPDRTRTSRSPALVAYLAAAAFAIAALWSALSAAHLTLAAPPPPVSGETLDAGLHRWFAWFVTTLPQERLNTGIAIVGMLCLIAVGAFLADRLGRLPGYAVGLGAAAWIFGSVLMLGGHRAVGLMAAHRNPLQTVDSINFTVDTITETFQLTAFALMGCGLIGFAAVAARGRAATGTWAAFTAFTGAAMLVLAGAYAAGNGDLATWIQAAGGVLLLPVWLVWTAKEGPPING